MLDRIVKYAAGFYGPRPS